MTAARSVHPDWGKVVAERTPPRRSSSSARSSTTDQLAMARLPRATYALLVALLPATAAVIGALVLAQLPTFREALGIGLVLRR
jgi:hypothetical protein